VESQEDREVSFDSLIEGLAIVALLSEEGIGFLELALHMGWFATRKGFIKVIGAPFQSIIN